MGTSERTKERRTDQSTMNEWAHETKYIHKNKLSSLKGRIYNSLIHPSGESDTTQNIIIETESYTFVILDNLANWPKPKQIGYLEVDGR